MAVGSAVAGDSESGKRCLLYEKGRQLYSSGGLLLGWSEQLCTIRACCDVVIVSEPLLYGRSKQQSIERYKKPPSFSRWQSSQTTSKRPPAHRSSISQHRKPLGRSHPLRTASTFYIRAATLLPSATPPPSQCANTCSPSSAAPTHPPSGSTASPGASTTATGP